LQRITAQQLNLNPILIVATNSTGGVMGKMIDAQSIMSRAPHATTIRRSGRSRLDRFSGLYSFIRSLARR